MYTHVYIHRIIEFHVYTSINYTHRRMPAHQEEPVSQALAHCGAASADLGTDINSEWFCARHWAGGEAGWSQQSLVAPQRMNLTSDTPAAQRQQYRVPRPAPSRFLSLYIPAKVTCVISSLGTSAPAVLLKDVPRAERKLMKLVASNISLAIVDWEQQLWLHILAPCLGCIWCVPVDNTGVISLSSSNSLYSPETETINTNSRYTEGWGSWSKQETQGDEKQIGLWCGDWGRTQVLLAPHLPCKSAQPHSQHCQQSRRLFSSFQNLQQYHKCWFFSIQLHHLDDIYESLWVSIKSRVFCRIYKSAHDLKFVMKSYGLELIFFFFLMKLFGDISEFFRMQ